MLSSELLSLGYALLQDHGLSDWAFKLDRSKTRAGLCNYTTQTISVSHLLAQQDEASIRNVVLHEIAHALVGPSHQHDAVWKDKAIAIGSDGNRCHTLQLSIAPYRVACSCGKVDFCRHRLTLKLYQTKCRHCESPLSIYVVQNPEHK